MMDFLHFLPAPLWIETAQLLDVRTLLDLQCCSKFMAEVCCHPALWRELDAQRARWWTVGFHITDRALRALSRRFQSRTFEALALIGGTRCSAAGVREFLASVAQPDAPGSRLPLLTLVDVSGVRRVTDRLLLALAGALGAEQAPDVSQPDELPGLGDAAQSVHAAAAQRLDALARHLSGEALGSKSEYCVEGASGAVRSGEMTSEQQRLLAQDREALAEFARFMRRSYGFAQVPTTAMQTFEGMLVNSAAASSFVTQQERLGQRLRLEAEAFGGVSSGGMAAAAAAAAAPVVQLGTGGATGDAGGGGRGVGAVPGADEALARHLQAEEDAAAAEAAAAQAEGDAAAAAGAAVDVGADGDGDGEQEDLSAFITQSLFGAPSVDETPAARATASVWMTASASHVRPLLLRGSSSDGDDEGDWMATPTPLVRSPQVGRRRRDAAQTSGGVEANEDDNDDEEAEPDETKEQPAGAACTRASGGHGDGRGGGAPAGMQSQLRHLNLSSCLGVTDRGVRALVPVIGRLQTLRLKGCTNVGDASLAAVVRACSQTLRVLDLQFCAEACARTMSAVGCCAALEWLRLFGCRAVTDAELVPALAGCGRSLRHLNLFGLLVTDDSLRAVGANCGQLARINLCSCASVTDSGVLAVTGGCPLLHSLVLGRCVRLTDAALEFIGFYVGARLLALDLSQCPRISSEGVAGLARQCGSLRRLSLAGCRQLQDGAVRALSDGARVLTHLNLFDCVQLTEGSALSIAAHLHELRRLSLLGCSRIPKRAVDMIVRRCLQLEHPPRHAGGTGAVAVVTRGKEFVADEEEEMLEWTQQQRPEDMG